MKKMFFKVDHLNEVSDFSMSILTQNLMATPDTTPITTKFLV